MRNKLMLIVLFSFAIVACENVVNDDNGNTNGKDTRLIQTMQTMSKDINKVSSTGDPDKDFVLIMKIHHKGAIDMANYELLRGKNDTVKQFADTIVRLHTLEVAKLDSFAKGHTVVKDSVNGKAFWKDADEAMAKMDSLIKVRTLSGNVDHDFLVLMIEHHRSGVELADAEIQNGQSDTLKSMVTQIREGAVEELSKMEAMLDENY